MILVAQSRRSRVLLIFGAAVFLAATFFVFFLWVGSTRLIVTNRLGLEKRHHELLADPAEYGLRLEALEVISHDDRKLQVILATRSIVSGTAEKTKKMEARLRAGGIEATGTPRGTLFLLHGRGGRKEDMLAVAQRFVAADFRCVVYDARGHGRSGGVYCTFGKHEVRDLQSVASAIDGKLRDRGEKAGSVGLFGNSLGAAVALQSLTSCRLPGKGATPTEAVVVVAPFSDLPEIVSLSGRRVIHRNLPEWLSRCCLRVGGWRAGFDPFSIVPLRSVAVATTPLFVVHGTKDGVTPVSEGKRIFEAAATKTKVWREVATGSHGNVLAEGGDDLYEEMIHFYLRHLNHSGPTVMGSE